VANSSKTKFEIHVDENGERVNLQEAAPVLRRCAMTFALVMVSLLSFWPARNARAASGSARGGQANGSPDTTTGCDVSATGSTYIPVDSWIYPAMLRLYSLGFLDHIYLGMRPWTWASLSHMLEGTVTNIENAHESPLTDEARKLYDSVNSESLRRINSSCAARLGALSIESVYSVFRGISGTPLDDSFHLGQTIVNDYGRPYENGFNSYSGAGGYAIVGPFTIYLRGEFQGAPSAAGYPLSLAQALSAVDLTISTDPTTNVTNYYLPQTTIPQRSIGKATRGRFLEAYLSTQMFNHVISFGKQDEWLGPAEGASFAYSNNAENIYAFHINRVEPLYVPVLSRFTGPFRYEFLMGPLRGHTLMLNPAYPGSAANPQPNVINPGNPWVHVEKISFRPTDSLEFGFERTALFGGEGHSPVTIHTFLKSFFSLSAPNADVKDSRNDPGARFAAFDFSWRLPFMRNWLTFYSDSEVHDDVSPIDNPRHASFRPGIYLSHLPGIPRLDVRAEAACTDPSAPQSNGGKYMYWESIEKQGYTNQGQIFGDWIGREDKGGQAWITYHLSGNEWIQASWRHQKAAKDFIQDGTTQYGTTLNDFKLQAVKRIRNDFEVEGAFALEHWKAPIYLSGEQTVTATTIQFTWFPERSIGF